MSPSLRLATLSFVASLLLFQGFEVFDWESGVARFVLLLGVGGLCAAARWAETDRRRRWTAPSRPTVVLVVVAVAVLGGQRLVAGVDAAIDVARGAEVAGDQGPNIHAAFTLIERGDNPYGPAAVVDIVELESVVTSRDAKDCLTRSASDQLATMKRFYATFDVSSMPRVDVDSSSRCSALAARAEALGFKYGPVMIAAHAPGLRTGGAAGMQWTNIVLFVLLVALTFALAWRYAAGRVRWFTSALAVAIVIAPTIVLRCTLRATDADLLPTVLGLAGLWCIESRRPRSGAVLVGLSIGAKLLPGMLFVPLFFPRSSDRSVAAVRIVIAVVAIVYLPFAVWDAGGLWANFVRFNFVRASDSTSVVHYVPDALSKAMLVAVLGGLVWLYRRIVRDGWTTGRRLNFLVAAHLGVLATGPILHNNYLVWLLPVVALLLSHAVGSGVDETRLELPESANEGRAVDMVRG